MIIQASVPLQNFFFHAAMLPVAGGAFAGLAFALFRIPNNPFRQRESESLMNFSSLGKLRCICGTSHLQTTRADRREFCRSCGCEVVQADQSLLDRQISQTQARQLTRELRDAARLASRLELPASITCIAELQAYLATDTVKTRRPIASSRSAEATEQTQIQ